MVIASDKQVVPCMVGSCASVSVCKVKLQKQRKEPFQGKNGPNMVSQRKQCHITPPRQRYHRSSHTSVLPSTRLEVDYTIITDLISTKCGWRKGLSQE